MPPRSWESELRIGVAAQSSDVVAQIELAVMGDTTAVDEDRAIAIEDSDPAQFDADTKRIYGLNDEELAAAKARCVGKVVGMQTGKEFFNGQA